MKPFPIPFWAINVSPFGHRTQEDSVLWLLYARQSSSNKPSWAQLKCGQESVKNKNEMKWNGRETEIKETTTTTTCHNEKDVVPKSDLVKLNRCY